MDDLMNQVLNILQTEACELPALMRLQFMDRALISIM